MNFQYFSDFKEMSFAGFQTVKNAIDAKPDLLFCVASGGSPSGLYGEMADWKSKTPDFCSNLRVVKLDEWGGLEEGSDFTSEYDVQRKFIKPLEISSDRYLTIDPFDPDPVVACEKMEKNLNELGPIDICILGIGTNGHIALNEPSEVLVPEFHIAELAASTLNNGMIKSLTTPPTFGMTMGMANILQSRKILLFVAGSGKQEAFLRLKEAAIDTHFPASFLWLHPDVDILVDGEAV